MKRIISLTLSILLLAACIIPSNASETETVLTETLSYNETVLDDGTVVIDELFVESRTRSEDKVASRRKVLVRDGVTIAEIEIQGYFRYDGSTVQILAKVVAQSNTYDGWEYHQDSFTSSGGTITLNGHLTKWFGILRHEFVMTLSCDANGNISDT